MKISSHVRISLSLVALTLFMIVSAYWLGYIPDEKSTQKNLSFIWGSWIVSDHHDEKS